MVQLSDIVRERRQAFLSQRTITPPRGIGTPRTCRRTRSSRSSSDWGPEDEDPSTVTGYPASRGVVTGVAKVVMTLDETDNSSQAISLSAR